MPSLSFPRGGKFLLLLAIIAMIITGAWWWQRPPSEPVYHGERFTAWANNSPAFTSYTELTVEQLHVFGPALIPWLTYACEYGLDLDDADQTGAFHNAPEWLRRWAPRRWGGLRQSPDTDIFSHQARWALIQLGPEAAPAIPALGRCLKRYSQRPARDDKLEVIVIALHRAGPTSWPVVQDALEHGSPQVRCRLLSCMHERLRATEGPMLETEGTRVARTLIKACRDPDPAIRASAGPGLGFCVYAQPEFPPFTAALPEVFRLLADPNADVRARIADILTWCGDKAAPAIPRVIEMLDDPDEEVRYEAAETLGQVSHDSAPFIARLRTMAEHDPASSCRNSAKVALDRLARRGRQN